MDFIELYFNPTMTASINIFLYILVNHFLWIILKEKINGLYASVTDIKKISIIKKNIF